MQRTIIISIRIEALFQFLTRDAHSIITRVGINFNTALGIVLAETIATSYMIDTDIMKPMLISIIYGSTSLMIEPSVSRITSPTIHCLL